MRRFLIAVAAALAALPASAHAADWYRVGGDSQGVTYTDLDSVTREGEDIIVWEYAIFPTPTDTDMTGAKSRMALRCRDRSYRIVHTIVYRRDGSSDAYPQESPRRFAAPDTIIENMILFHCGDRQRGVRLAGVSPEDDARRLP